MGGGGKILCISRNGVDHRKTAITNIYHYLPSVVRILLPKKFLHLARSPKPKGEADVTEISKITANLLLT